MMRRSSIEASAVPTTDAEGRIWILFGIDSGFETESHLYYLDATITAK